jgi:hypothetical protein
MKNDGTNYPKKSYANIMHGWFPCVRFFEDIV